MIVYRLKCNIYTECFTACAECCRAAIFYQEHPRWLRAPSCPLCDVDKRECYQCCWLPLSDCLYCGPSPHTGGERWGDHHWHWRSGTDQPVNTLNRGTTLNSLFSPFYHLLDRIIICKGNNNFIVRSSFPISLSFHCNYITE